MENSDQKRAAASPWRPPMFEQEAKIATNESDEVVSLPPMSVPALCAVLKPDLIALVAAMISARLRKEICWNYNTGHNLLKCSC
jgi:hypothetical protein